MEKVEEKKIDDKTKIAKKETSKEASKETSKEVSKENPKGEPGVREEMKDVGEKKTRVNHGLTESLVERGAVREMLLCGDYPKAEAFLQTCFRDIWDEDANIRLSLAALQFIERVHKGLLIDAVHFAQDRLLQDDGDARFVSRDADGYERYMEAEELFQLLCYEDIERSGVKHLLSPIQREAVADYINGKILLARSDRSASVLEISLQQLILNETFRLEKANMLGPQFALKI